MSEPISIQFTRFSAFYSPLIATMAGGFLQAEGFAPKHSIAPAGKSAIEGVVDGSVQVCQSAPSQGFGPLEKGETPPAVHFAQINEMDGFFLTGRAADPAFTWQKLAGKKVLVDHGGQPLAMVKYACHRRGLDYQAIQAVNVPSGQMDAAFRKGEGDYIHQPNEHTFETPGGALPRLPADCVCRHQGQRQPLGQWLRRRLVSQHVTRSGHVLRQVRHGRGEDAFHDEFQTGHGRGQPLLPAQRAA